MAISARKIGKIALIILGSLFIIVTLLILSLRLPGVQNMVKGKLVNYLEKKIGTDVALDKVFVDYPSNLSLKNLYLQGEDVDTLLYAESLEVRLNIPDLLKNKATISAIDLQTLRTNVVRHEDGRFNFDYILDAFATKNQPPPEKESKPFIISLDKLTLDDINVSFIDQQSANDLSIWFGHFDTRVKRFNIYENDYALSTITMDSLKLYVEQDVVEEVAEESKETVDSLAATKPLKIDLEGVNLTYFDIGYNDYQSETEAKIKFEEFIGKVNKIDLKENVFDIEKLRLAGADIQANLRIPSSSTEQNNAQNPNTQSTMPTFFIAKTEFEDVAVEYNNIAIPKTNRGLDYNHLNFSKLTLDLRDLEIKENHYSGKIKQAIISEQSGLNVQELTTNFTYENNQAYLKNLYLKTPRTTLRDYVILNYSSLNELSSHTGNVQLNANIDQSHISFADILLVAPQLRNTSPFNTYPNETIHIDTRLTGTINNLTIGHLVARGFNDTHIDIEGKITEVMNPTNLGYNLSIRDFSSTATTVQSILPPNTIPESIQLPEEFALSGKAAGTTKVVDAELALQSTFGNVNALADINMIQKGQETYTIDATTESFNLGELIKNKEVGTITGEIQANGTGFAPEYAKANVNATISSADFKNYTYEQVDLQGNIENGQFKVNLNSTDENANLQLVGAGIYEKEAPKVELVGDIQQLNLGALNFTKEPLIFTGNIDADFSNANPDYLNGELHVTDLAISDTKEIYPLQNIALIANASTDSNSLKLTSDVLQVNIEGDYKLTQISGAMMQTVNEYYQFQEEKLDSLNRTIDPGQYFNLTAKVKNGDLIQKFLPELKEFEDITIEASYHADEQELAFNAEVPNLVYQTYTLQEGKITVDNDEESLQYDLAIAEVGNEKLQLNALNVNGDVADNSITYQLTTKDETDEVNYDIAGKASLNGGITTVSLNEELLLNEETWQVPSDNEINIGKETISVSNFLLQQNGSSIQLQTNENNPSNPLEIDIRNFYIHTITELVSADSLLADGIINGTATLKNPTGDLDMEADITIDDIKLYNNDVGNLTLVAKNQSPQIVELHAALSGNENDVNVQGTYNLEGGQPDLTVDLRQLNMETIEAFSFGEIKNSNGYLSGNLNVKGTTAAPEIRGSINFNDVGLFVKQLGTRFTDINESVELSETGIVFSTFSVFDDRGNDLRLNGKIKTTNYQDFVFDLTVQADDFKIVDSENDGENMLYGVLALDTDMVITGNMDLPVVNGTLGVTDETDFTFVIPQSSQALQERKGIVQFVDRDQDELQHTLKSDTLNTETRVKGMDVSVNIDVDEEAIISIIIDRANGDFVKLRGEGQLTGGVDVSGKTTLVGTYEVNEGAYEVSVGFMNRSFDIQEGSTIIWQGEPLEADLNITAVYETEAAPVDLLGQQLGDLSAQEYNMYKQRLPFNVLLNLTGKLMKPKVEFDITTADNNPSVSAQVTNNVTAKLSQMRNQESEMNKQVFALLLLNRFIGENPFQSEAGMSTEGMARQSVSRLLSQELNNLAGDLIQGVDLEFDLESREDYSTGTKENRTDLNVQLSKTLLNDRLTVNVGSNFGLEGDARANEQTTNIAGDVSVEYQLSKDGRYLLRAYRVDQYQVALQGQVIETGIGFIFTIEYDHFKDIFEKVKKNKAIRNEENDDENEE